MLKYADPFPLEGDEKASLLQFAQEIARKAGAATLPFFRADVAVENKLSDGRFDPVTHADRAAETVIREEIERNYPNHGILGEEFGHKPGNGLTWVIDPIDGTRAFVSGFLHWGVLIGLFDGERPVLGVMYQPFTQELFTGVGNSASYQQGNKRRLLRASEVQTLDAAVLATTSPRFFDSPRELAAFEALERLVKLSRYGGDCYIYGMLAMGYVDIALDSGLKAYDIQGLIPIIEGAGGVVSCADGGDASMGGLIVASANRTLHDLALAAFSEVT